jgi:PBP1b-binding outer membrane lipoprotein LpoB
MTEPTPSNETAIVEISPQTDALVEKEMAGESDDLKQETKALIDAIKKRAQAEAAAATETAQSVGTMTRDAYLEAVRKAKESLEQNQLLFERDRVEYSMKLIQMEAEKNWESILNEVKEWGDRLTDAAKAAWEKLTAPRQ